MCCVFVTKCGVKTGGLCSVFVTKYGMKTHREMACVVCM